MASSGKKGKKSKGKTITLTDFLQESPGVPTLPVKKYNWSDEVEDALDGGFESRGKSNVALPTAPRAARGPDISEDRIPTHPPFNAYISNLPYDIEEDDIAMFFANMNISGMRLPRDDRGGEGGKLKGFGYVEFEDRNSLIEAISILDTNLKGRRIKIDVATNSDSDRRRGGRMDIGRERPERPEVTMGDWRSGPREQPSSDSRDGRGGGGFSRDRDRDRDREGGPPESNRTGAWRENVERPSFERGGGFKDSDRDRGRFGVDGERRSGYGPRRNYGGDREGGFERDRDGGQRRDDGPPLDRDAARSRPKLLLAPRTKPLEEQQQQLQQQQQQQHHHHPPGGEVNDQPSAAAPVPAASIFGAAKPVDTSVRERQIEERLKKEKDVGPSVRDTSRDNKGKDDDDERPPKREAWGRKRNDESDDSGRKESPDRRPSSRGAAPARKTDDRRVGVTPPRDRDRAPARREEKAPAPKREDRPAREGHEKEMPKLKEPEPPNFAASNKFATLEADDMSD